VGQSNTKLESVTSRMRISAESPTTFTLNAQPVTVSAFPDEPLLHVLRDRLDHTGPRFGCGLNQCGACKVLVDGRPVAACDTPIWSVAERSVVTIEGLADSALAMRLQRAFEDLQAGQCGACLSGIMVTLSHAIEKRTVSDEASLRAALNEHLCRCGSHPRIVAAALSVIQGSGSGEGATSLP
jgi:nicotinate dehydrogenase subunit A